LAISADGRGLAQANGTEITLWDVSERKRLRRWQHEGEGVNDMAFSPSGDRLAVAARYKGPLAIYDLSPGDNQRVELEGQSDSSEWVAFSPDGKMVAGSCSEPRGSKPVRRASSLRVWDAATGEVIHNIKGSVSGGDFSPDSRLLAAAKGSKNVILYNTTTGQEVQRLPEVNKSVRLVAFSQDGAVLAAADVHRIRLWQTDSWKEIEFGSGHQEPILAMAFSPDGRTIATGGLDGQLIQWSWPGGKEQHRIKGIASSWGIQNLAFSPDGHMIGATGWNNRGDMYFVFDTATGTPISQFGKDTRGGGVISFLPGSKQVITDGKDGAIRVWDAKTGTLDRQIGEHESRIIALHPMAGSHKAWWAGAYQGLGLRDLTTGENELLINGDYNSYSYVPLVVSPQQDWLAIGRHVWDLKTHEIITKLPGVPCAFSSDGRLLALAKGETVAIWERLTRREIHSFDGGGFLSGQHSAGRRKRLVGMGVGHDRARAERVLTQ
jgi:WD40 repeat protein